MSPSCLSRRKDHPPKQDNADQQVLHFIIFVSSTFQPVQFFFSFSMLKATPQEEIMLLFETENTSGNYVVF